LVAWAYKSCRSIGPSIVGDGATAKCSTNDLLASPHKGYSSGMRIVIFGLTISSSWGNGHATLWRGLGRALAERGHRLIFFEKDLPYYAQNRDLLEWPHGELVLYQDWSTIAEQARARLSAADVGLITSYCPDAIDATKLLTACRKPLKIFYDMDTPVTLQCLRNRGSVDYLPAEGFRDFDLVISFTGGEILRTLQKKLGARRVATLYGHADPLNHQRQEPYAGYAGALSYLGTFASDRQQALERLLIQPARTLTEDRFIIAGSLYPENFPWTSNIFFVRHLPPSEHGKFYSSSNFSLNITRKSMADSGYCPSGRLFEAASCQAAIITDRWAGLEDFFEPGKEILVADNTDDVVGALSLPVEEIKNIGRAAHLRFLQQHSSDRRARELEHLLEAA
jgi:spore maturation protein CgeB